MILALAWGIAGCTPVKILSFPYSESLAGR